MFALQAKLLEQMDEEFGVGDLVEQEFGARKNYDSKHLSGLTVEHAQESFKEGKTVILTLKDKGLSLSQNFYRHFVSFSFLCSDVLNEEESDTLVNVNIVDDEKAAENVENKKGKPDYRPYEDTDIDEYGMVSSDGPELLLDNIVVLKKQ